MAFFWESTSRNAVFSASPLLPSPSPSPSHTHHHHHKSDSCSRLTSRSTRLCAPAAGQMLAGRDAGGGTGGARRRRERLLRSMLRHERMSVAMALAESLHHSARRPEKASARAREVEEQDQHEAFRRQKTPPPWMRPEVLQDPAPQGRVGQHSGIGYELVLALDVPVLQMVEQPVDASALAFLEEAEAKDLEV